MEKTNSPRNEPPKIRIKPKENESTEEIADKILEISKHRNLSLICDLGKGKTLEVEANTHMTKLDIIEEIRALQESGYEHQEDLMIQYQLSKKQERAFNDLTKEIESEHFDFENTERVIGRLERFYEIERLSKNIFVPYINILKVRSIFASNNYDIKDEIHLEENSKENYADYIIIKALRDLHNDGELSENIHINIKARKRKFHVKSDTEQEIINLKHRLATVEFEN